MDKQTAFINKVLNDQLYDKMVREHNEFLRSLQDQSADVALKHALEHSVHEEILSLMDAHALPTMQAAVLLDMKNPLEDITREYINGTSYLDDVLDHLVNYSKEKLRAAQEPAEQSADPTQAEETEDQDLDEDETEDEGEDEDESYDDSLDEEEDEGIVPSM